MDNGSEESHAQFDRMLGLIYDELRAIAARLLENEQHAQSLQPTALVHEAYQRLTGATNLNPEQRSAFLAAASVAMRRILVEHARARTTAKRGGGAAPLSLDTSLLDAGAERGSGIDIERLDQALTKLQQISPRQAQVVERRFFGGLGYDQIAAGLGISNRQAKKDWEFAKAFLHRELAGHANEVED